MNQSCFLCHNRGNVSVRNTVNLFGQNTKLQSGKKLLDVVREIIEKPVEEANAHSTIICKKCHKLCTEYDDIQIRLKEIKKEVTEQFKNTVKKQNINYETFQKDTKTSTKTQDGITKKKFEGKKIVLPASKLQPLPADYIFKIGNLPISSRPNIIVRGKSMPPKSTSAVVSSAVTHNIKTETITSEQLEDMSNVEFVKCMDEIDSTIENITGRTKKITKNSTLTEPSLILDATNNSIATILSTNSSNTITLNSLPKDLFSSAIITKVESNALSVKKGIVKEIKDNNEQPMEIDEECSYAVITSSRSEKDESCSSSKGSGSESSPKYVDVSLLGELPADGEGYVVGKLEILSDRGDDDDDEHTILMQDEDGSILQVVSGQRVMYGDNEISLVIPDDGEDQQDDGDNDGDSQEWRSIEVEVSGDGDSAAEGEGEEEESRGDESGEGEFITPTQFVEKNGVEFICLLCEKSKDKESSSDGSSVTGHAAFIMRHMKTEHDARIYICHICDKILWKRCEYTVHIREHSQKSSKLVAVDKTKFHECTVCKKKYNSRMLLSEHMNVHSGSRPYACAACGKTFASKYTHQAHLKTHLDRPRPFHCTQCNKSFLTQQNLTQHEKTHSGRKDFVCSICNKAFGTQHNLAMHGVVHSGRRPFACAVSGCTKRFARRAELRDHSRTHTGERPFVCATCGAAFAQRSNLQSHRRATHLLDRRHACRRCDKRFKRRRLLEYHIRAAHTGERPLKCEVCSATFVYPEHYKKHLMIHSGEKPYVCEVCGKSFNSRDNRNTHRFVHSDKKPYECVVCGAGYMRKQLLYTHMNTSGHLAGSIVVNQPRVANVNTGSYEVVEELKLENVNTTVGKVAVSEVAEEPVLLTSTEGDTGAKSAAALLEGATTAALESTQIMSTEEAGGMLQLVQIQLPNGNNGWVAINP